MKHQARKGRRFGRKKGVREAFLRGLTVALIKSEKMTTTEARAKELARVIAPYVTRARQGTLAARRQIAENLPPRAVEKLMNEIAPRYKDRAGGYTRITKIGIRKHDAAPLARIEFV